MIPKTYEEALKIRKVCKKLGKCDNCEHTVLVNENTIFGDIYDCKYNDVFKSIYPRNWKKKELKKIFGVGDTQDEYIEELEGACEDYQKEIERLRKKIQKIQKAIGYSNKEKKDLREELSELTNNKITMESIQRNEIERLNNKVENLKKKSDDYVHYYNSLHDDAISVLDSYFKVKKKHRKATQHIRRLKEELTKLKADPLVSINPLQVFCTTIG